MQTPTSAVGAANWFITRTRRRTPLNFLKLSMLTCYAQAWHLGITSRPLFSDDLLARPYGPGITNLDIAFRNQRHQPLTHLGRELGIDAEGHTSFRVPVASNAAEPFLTRILDVYGHRTAIELCNMTHRDNEPWTCIANAYGHHLKDSPPISQDLIRALYKRRATAHDANIR